MPGLPNPWLILGVVVAILSAATTGYFKGRADMDASYKAAALEAALEVAKETAGDAAVTQAAGQQAAETKEVVRTRTRTIIKEVKVYVPVEADRACAIPNSVVRLHDAAAAGRTPVPEPAGKPDGRPSGVELSGLTEAVVGNYGTCHEIREQLIGLQDWIRQMQARWSRP